MSAGAAPVLVTRPAGEAARWVRGLQERGIDARSLPLIEIGPAPDPQALAAVRARLGDFAAVMFVSAHAVQGLLPESGAWPTPGGRAWATGPGTAAALRAAGVPPERIDAPADDAARFDSEALWQRVRGQVRPGGRVLIVRGADGQGRPGGRDWLAQQLREAGLQVEVVASYCRTLPHWQPGQQALAHAAQGAWWLFSSSEAVSNLGLCLPGQDWSAARAVCTHPRIAAAARRLGFGRVEQVRPTLDDLAAFLQSEP